MRYDIETAVAQCFADYLKSTVEAPILAICPVVTFFDPMSIDDAHRIIVHCDTAQSDPTSVGNFDCRVSVDVKSQWTQENIAVDFQAHFRRVNEVRDKLWPAILLASLQALQSDGLLIEYPQPRRDLSTKIFKDSNFLLSETAFNVRAMVTGPPVYN
jgi:hypothetical protein